MSTLAVETDSLFAKSVEVTEDYLVVDLEDGRKLSVPLAWYPRLQAGNVAERNNWRLIGRGEGIHWPDLDEDIGTAGLIAGRPSAESHSSLRKWLAGRRATST